MGTTADKLNKILETKQAIKQAIINKGVEVADDTVFADYPAKITSIESGDSESVWDMVTNNYTRFEYLFYDCSNLTSLDLSNWDTSNGTNMSSMFYYCQSLTSLDLSNWNTRNITTMRNMFYGCNSLTTIDSSNWDTSNVTDMYSMFGSCPVLTSLNVSNWNTSNVKDMSNMFNSCRLLTSLDLSNWGTSNVKDMSYMFSGCFALTSLDVSSWDVGKVTNMTGMFNYCNALTSLDLSGWDVGHIKAYYYFYSIINNCPALVDFKAPKNISTQMDVSKTTALSHDSLMSIINNLITRTSTETLTFGATNLAKLSSDEIAIATNKGWTIK